MKNTNKAKNTTIFLDVDGCIVKHNSDPDKDQDVILPYVVKRIKEWKNKNYFIILTTARSKNHCNKVVRLFKKNGITFDKLIFEIPAGKRILINDYKDVDDKKAISINIKRDKGLSKVVI